ncbi:MAG: hypothetical protein FJ039_07575 [Chloroflexi bacterium]|nr:hypothetical protein [Chloroflexota bacterium]
MFTKVKLGFFSFGAVTKAGEHQSYNFWHMYDHIPDNMALEGVAYGQRWVCPPEYQKIRTAMPSIAGHQYMTLYLMQEPADRTLKDFLDLGPQLEAVGRFNQYRTSYMGGTYMLIKAYASPRVLVSPGSVPYRPNTGLFVAATDLVTQDPLKIERVNQWFDQVHIPDLLTVKHVAGIYWFRAKHDAPGGRTGPANPPGRTIRVYYLDGDPMEMLDDMKAKLPTWKKQGRIMDYSDTYKPILGSLYKTIPPDSKFDWFDEKPKGKK